LTAAIYAARARLETIVLEKLSIGGLITTSDWVDNFPGFPEGISGEELGERFRKHAERFVGHITLNAVTSIRKENDRYYLGTDTGEIQATSVILCTGSEPVKLPVPQEEQFRARGFRTAPPVTQRSSRTRWSPWSAGEMLHCTRPCI